MATPVILPKLEMSQESATIMEWLVEEGDQVRQGQPLLVVETDKVSVEIEAPASGVVSGIRFGPQQTVPVTTVIAHILAPGEPLASDETRVSESSGERSAAVPDRTAPEPVVQAASPVARRMASALGVDLSTVTGSGPGGRVTKDDVLAAAEPSGPAPMQSLAVRATPAARRLARLAGIDLRSVTGSGPRQRIQAVDVRAAQVAATAAQTLRVPLTGMRGTIARRLSQSWQTIPHATFTVEVDMAAAEALRAELNRRADGHAPVRVSVTALLVKACALALQRHPMVNATLQGEEIIVHGEANIGVAVALEDGLIVPVIKDAQGLDLAGIAARLEDLVGRARSGRLAPADVSGGTFTLSNLGGYRVDRFTAIVNPPQVAILAVGRIARRPVVVETAGGEALAIRPTMAMTLSVDHRVLDGAVAASFLQALAELLEQPAQLV
jgi:pyruvate dehydrogenase E2 component (dihydrolipoamide acetyltransferase)